MILSSNFRRCLLKSLLSSVRRFLSSLILLGMATAVTRSRLWTSLLPTDGLLPADPGSAERLRLATLASKRCQAQRVRNETLLLDWDSSNDVPSW